jgi:hypothetical protein
MLVSDAGFNNFALWKSNGTTAGTVRVKLLPSGDHRLFGVGGSEVMNGVLYFAAEPRRVWRTDGTDCGTYTIDYENPFDFVSLPSQMTTTGSTLFFTGGATTVGAELFKLEESDVPESPCLLATARVAQDSSMAKEILSEDERSTLSEMALYPNPFTHELTLQVEGPDNASYRTSIIHVNGMTVEEHNDMKYNVGYSVGRGLSSGVYLLKVHTNNGMKIKRIVKVD